MITRASCVVLSRTSADSEASITITTDRLDRMRDRVLQDGLSFREWLATGGPVLWAHDPRALPVGKATAVMREGSGHRMRFRFLAHDEAQRVRQAFDAGVLSSSIGFLAEATRPNEAGGADIVQASVVEVSLTPVPANPDCHRTLKALGLTAPDVIATPADLEGHLLTRDDEPIDLEAARAVICETARRFVRQEIARVFVQRAEVREAVQEATRAALRRTLEPPIRDAIRHARGLVD
jgi:HK97 family phage prohead protease